MPKFGKNTCVTNNYSNTYRTQTAGSSLRFSSPKNQTLSKKREVLKYGIFDNSSIGALGIAGEVCQNLPFYRMISRNGSE